MSTFATDVRYSLRQLRRQPLYASTIVLLMVLGIAGNVAVFRVLNGMFLRPLPFDHPEQLVDLDETAPQWDLEYVSVAFQDFDQWRSDNRTFQAMSVYRTGGLNLSGEGAAERVDYVASTHDMDQVLGIRPRLGRFYDETEDLPNAPRVALIADGFWADRYGRSPDVLGQPVTLNGESVEIIGVLGPEAGFLADADFWVPLRVDPAAGGPWTFSAIGRLRDGATVEQASADLLAVHRSMIPERSVNEITSPVVQPLRDRYLGEYRLAGSFLMAAVAAVLLIACANIAGLVLARSLSRDREIAVRLAMGAPRSRIVRQLLTESSALALLGGAIGGSLGLWGSTFVVGGLGDDLPAWVRFDLDPQLVFFVIAATVAAALLFGLAPAIHSASSGSGRLNSITRSTATRGRRRTMNLLVAGEVSLALALLVVGGMTMLDLRWVGSTEPGFDPGDVVTWTLQLPSPQYTSEARMTFADRYLEQLQAIPGVEAATIANALPLGGHHGYFFDVVGKPERTEEEGNPVVLNRAVTAGYFSALRVELAAGRPFDAFDGREDGARVAIIDETFARTFFAPGEDPVGRSIRYSGSNDDDALTIVGVARDVKHYGLDEDIAPGVYQPLNQLVPTSLQVAVRTAGERAAVMTAARTATTTLDPGLALYDIAPLEQTLDQSIWARRATTWVIGLFSLIALVLAVAGLYGLVSYTVGQRSREIGIRLAVGARAGQVGRQVVVEGLRIVALGTVAGLALAWAGARLASGLLLGVSATNPAIYVVVATLLISVALAANALPALRAARTDPTKALRE